MPSKTLQGGLGPGSTSDDLARFYANLADGLHALAQPLTILRSSVAALDKPGITDAAQQRYLQLSNRQAIRACDLFELLQDLLIAQQSEPEFAPVDVSELLLPVIGDQKAVLRASGVDFRADLGTGCPDVRIDVTKTLQALFVVLKIAASISSAGDVIELLVTAGKGFVQLTVHNSRVHGRLLNSSEHLGLAVAAANMRSQRGEFRSSEDPFSAILALPLEEAIL